MKLMERILSGKPSAKCLFSYIIMEKGGYLVGAFVLDFSFVPLTQLTFSPTAGCLGSVMRFN